jgi:hypothetical protein
MRFFYVLTCTSKPNKQISTHPKNHRIEADRNVDPDLTSEIVPGSTRRKRKKAK